MAFVVITLLLVLSPVIYESTLVVAARWQGLFGIYPNIRTPVLDAIGDNYQMATYDAKQWTRGIFHRTPWKSSYVIPIAIIFTGALATLMRK
jgi:hypothetical protein